MKKHLHIVCRYRSVSMQRMTEPLTMENSLPRFYEVTVSDTPDGQADINLHVPWHSLVGLEKIASPESTAPGKTIRDDRRNDKMHVMVYTHVNPTDEGALLDAASRADKIICMTFTGRAELIARGVEPKKLWVIYPGADGFRFSRRNIGVVGYEQPNARKRMHILLDLAWMLPEMEKQAIQWVLIGSGMETLAEQLQNCGMAATIKENANDAELEALYGQMDALLVTAYAEGGPLPLLEAWACGVRDMFAPRVGLAGDFLDQAHLYTTVEELAERLKEWLRPVMDTLILSTLMNWTQYAAEHAMVLGRMSGTSTEILPGCDRYAQLLEIIDEIKPKDIVEIGTWNGTRAIQMIQAAAAHRPIKSVSYVGFDLFEQQTSQDVMIEGSKLAYPYSVVERRLKATGADVTLVEGNTRSTLNHWDGLSRWADLYFIDGGHSAETVEHDWEMVAEKMKPSSVVVFDDYYHGREGLVSDLGCNQVVEKLKLDPKYRVEHLPVITVIKSEHDETNSLRIGMVKVSYANIPIYVREAYAGSAAFDGGGSSYYVFGVLQSNAPQAASSPN